MTDSAPDTHGVQGQPEPPALAAYELAIREALRDRGYETVETARTVAAAVRPLVDAEVAGARTAERERIVASMACKCSICNAARKRRETESAT